MENPEADLISWRPAEDARQECQQRDMHDEKLCENYITILSVETSTTPASSLNETNTRVLTCGTYASRPQCTWRMAESLADVLDTFDGIGKSPQTPDLSSTFVRLANGDHYFATSIDYTELGIKLDYLIDRSLGPSRQLRTDRYNSNWMNGTARFFNFYYRVLNFTSFCEIFLSTNK